MRRTIQRATVAMAAAALVLTGCGRGGDDSSAAAPGVTDEPCPNAVDKEKGCIYLGIISDLTGVFKGVGVPLTAGGKAFWDKRDQIAHRRREHRDGKGRDDSRHPPPMSGGFDRFVERTPSPTAPRR